MRLKFNFGSQLLKFTLEPPPVWWIFHITVFSSWKGWVFTFWTPQEVKKVISHFNFSRFCISWRVIKKYNALRSEFFSRHGIENKIPPISTFHDFTAGNVKRLSQPYFNYLLFIHPGSIKVGTQFKQVPSVHLGCQERIVIFSISFTSPDVQNNYHHFNFSHFHTSSSDKIKHTNDVFDKLHFNWVKCGNDVLTYYNESELWKTMKLNRKRWGAGLPTKI